MTWDPTPWFVGGGAIHSPEVARTLPYAVLGGKEGIVSPGDLKVSALVVPGSQVRVSPGVAAITSRASGGDRQTYIVRNPSDDIVSLAPTGSSSRTDLIVARVEDPFMPGESWPTPPDPATGVYVRTVVIPNVSPTATSLPAGTTGLPLARVTLPPNTATVTDSMVTSLRSLVAPQSSVYLGGVRKAGTAVDLTSPIPTEFPTSARAVIPVPSWATHAFVRGDLVGVYAVGGAAAGQLYVGIGNTAQSGGTYYNESQAAAQRSTYSNQTKITLTAADRAAGQITLNMAGLRSSGAGFLRADQFSQIMWTVYFSEEAV